MDLDARRTHRLKIAETIARKLEMNYVFGREFQELVQGSKDSPAYHGQATPFEVAYFEPAPDPLLETITFLAAPLVSAEDRAVSREARGPDSTCRRYQHCWQQAHHL